VIARQKMAQTQIASSKAETYRWGCEIECFLPDQAIRELGISIGSYHHGHPLPSPFPQVAKPEGPPWRSHGDLARWTAERDRALRLDRHAPLGRTTPYLRRSTRVVRRGRPVARR